MNDLFSVNEKYILNQNEQNICKFFKSEYIDNLVISDKDLEKRIKAANADKWKYGFPMRFNAIRAIALNTNMDTINTIVVVYKIKDISLDDREVIYNIAYLNIKSKHHDIFFDNNPELKTIDNQKSNLYINNICPIGGILSKDGEYRSTLLYWRMVKLIFTKQKTLGSMFKDIMKYFVDKFQDRKLLIYAHYYFPTDDLRNQYSFELELLVNNKKIEFYCVAWFIYYYIYTSGIISDHLNPTFQKVMQKYKHEDSIFFKSLVSKYSNENIQRMYHIFSTNIRSTTDRGASMFCKSKLGQKFIPVSLREIQYSFDIRFRPWKEYLVNIQLSNLVINNISPGFPITYGWIFIKNTDQHLFDNPSQYVRMEKSEQALEIAKILNQARYLSRQYINPSQVIENDEDSFFVYKLKKKYKKMITSWLSREFQILYDKIDDSITHSNLNIIMSNVTFCIFTEYVGKTFYESIFITKKSQFYRQLINNIFCEQGFNIFERFMFEICYNLHCCTSKYGVIHGDLHMHNITINDLFYKHWIKLDVSNPKVLYILDSANEYIFDTNFYYITIIDFSRAILNPSYLERFRTNPIHKSFDIAENIYEFEKQHHRALTDYLFSCKPEYKDMGIMLLNAIRLHFDVFYKILSVLDLFMISSRFIDFFKFKKDINVTPYIGAIDLVKRINSECDLYLTKTIDSAIRESEEQLMQRKDDEWPILGIINKVFSYKNIKNMKNINVDDIVDVYNYNNEIKYNINDSSNFPTPLYDLEKNKENDNYIRNSIKRRHEYEQQSLSNIKTLLLIKKRQREKNII